MSNDLMRPEIGQIVRVIKGRETNQYAVIIEITNERFVRLADGDKRKFNRPKRKNVKHIELTDFISNEIRNSLLETNRVSNGKLRFAIAKFRKEVVTYLEKGDVHDV